MSCSSKDEIRYWNDIYIFGSAISSSIVEVSNTEDCAQELLNHNYAVAFVYYKTAKKCHLKAFPRYESTYDGGVYHGDSYDSGTRCDRSFPSVAWRQPDGKYPAAPGQT